MLSGGLILLSLLLHLQNREGAILQSRIQLRKGDVKKQDGDSYRFRISGAENVFSERPSHLTVVFENGRRLVKLQRVKSLQSWQRGVYITTDTAIWVKPFSGNVENLEAKVPFKVPWWISLVVYSGTAIIFIISLSVGAYSDFFKWASKTSRKAVPAKRFVLRHAWIVPAISILISFAVFQKFILYEVAPFYPRRSDQNAYLSAAYRYHEKIHELGFWSPLTQLFSGNLSGDPDVVVDSFGGFGPNSNMSLIAGYFFYFFGASRYSALLIHFCSWAILLFSVYWSVSKISGKQTLGWMAAGTLLFTNMAMVPAGGIADFRMDFVASCWMGVSVAIWCLFIHHPRRLYAWLGSGAVAFLVFVRLISAASIGIPLAYVLFLGLYSFRTGKRRGLRHAIIPLISLGAFVASLVAANWRFIYEYYFKLSLETQLASRGADETWENGVFNALSYYPESLVFHHFGIGTLVILLIAAAFVGILSKYRHSALPQRRKIVVRKEGFLFVALSVIVPLVVLTANPHRTSHVAGVAVVPLALFGILCLISLRQMMNRNGMFLVGLLVCVLGTVTWSGNLMESAPFPGESRRDAEMINMVFAHLNFELQSKPPELRTVAVLDFLEATDGVWYFGREKLGMRFPVVHTFPTNIIRVDTDEIIATFREASAVIAPRDKSILERRPYHVSESIAEAFDATMSEVRARLPLHSTFSYKGVDYDLYLDSDQSRNDIASGLN